LWVVVFEIMSSAAVAMSVSSVRNGSNGSDGPVSAASSSSSFPSSLVSSLRARLQANSSAARHMFLANYAAQESNAKKKTEGVEEKSVALKLLSKIRSEYSSVEHLAAGHGARPVAAAGPGGRAAVTAVREEATGVLREVKIEDEEEDERRERAMGRTKDVSQILDRLPGTAAAAAAASPSPTPAAAASSSSTALVSTATPSSKSLVSVPLTARQQLIASKRALDEARPVWHAPWKLHRVISSHVGWVRCVTVDHSNEWFVTGSADRTIKIFDLASGTLKLTLTGHISVVRGLAVSRLSPYLFSCGEDKQVKCWDLTQNKVIRDYHGHLSGVYCTQLLESNVGPSVLVTGGRDSVARVWDVRTAAEVAVLGGHTQTVASLAVQNVLPQVITGSHDNTIKLWDLRKTDEALSTLTHHKKSVRALSIHPSEYTFLSGAGDNLKVWKCPEGTFMRNLSGHNTTVNALTINRENVVVSGGDNGSLMMWDYASGYSFQSIVTPPQPGSLDAEAGIFALAFDQTGSRLITAEADKTIKIYREDEDATEETHPINWRPDKRRKRF